ncbi:MAG: hypothetical protein ACRD22_15295 [Terriglobia bacterium]
MGDHVIRISAAAVSALKDGNKVKAVKITREAGEVSLKEAIDAIDDYLGNNADVFDTFLQRRKASNRTPALIFKIGLVLLLAAIVAKCFGY